MFDEQLDPSTRSELLRLTPSGDLLDLARQMRDLGVESLLLCAPSGRINQVVTDRQIAHLAANPDLASVGAAPPAADSRVVEPRSAVPKPADADADAEAAIPRQAAPARADYGATTRS